MTLSVFLSIMAIVVSIAALVLTVVQIKIQREHNFKSIKPIGAIDVGDYETDVYVSIINAGIGPMIINKIKVYNRTRSGVNLIDILPDNLGENIVWTEFVTQIEGRAIQAGETLYLVRALFPEDKPELTEELIEFRDDLRDCLKDVIIEFSYIDIYERNTYDVKRALTFFGE